MTRNDNDNKVSINYKESSEFLDRCKEYVPFFNINKL